MSNLATVLEPAVLRANSLFEKFEHRLPEFGVIEAFRRDTDTIVPKAQMEALKTSLRREVDIAVTTVTDANVLTKRAVNPARDVATTARVPTNWFTLGFAFKWVPASARDNYVSEDDEIGQNLFNGWKSVLFDDVNSLESQLLAFLEANKYSTLPSDIKVDGVTTGTDSFIVDYDKYILAAPVIMRALRIRQALYDISYVGSVARQRAIATFGTNNQQNLNQFINDMMYFMSSNMDVTEDMVETHYLTPVNSLGLLNIVEDDAAQGRSANDGYFTTIRDPWFGFRWGVRVSSVAEDNSVTYGDGFERAITRRYDVFADFSPIMAYSSKAGESPIVKVDLQKQ